MEYQIVDKSEVPSRGKWKALFDPFPENKAIMFTLPDKKSASRQGMRIYGSLKHDRVNYQIRYRTIPKGDKILLYVWKEAKDDN